MQQKMFAVSISNTYGYDHSPMSLLKIWPSSSTPVDQRQEAQSWCEQTIDGYHLPWRNRIIFAIHVARKGKM